MSTLNPPPTADLAALERRLDELVDKTARRKTMLIVGGVILALVTAAYLGYAWYRINSELDAPTVVAIAEQQAAPLLNQPATQWAQQLEDQAPALVDSAAEAALQAPAQLSAQLLEYVESAADERLPDLEEQFSDLVTSFVDQAADATEGEFTQGEMTDEQAQELVTAVADQFDESLREQIDTLYAEYTGVSGELIDRLNTLAVGENLSEKEQLHRDLITSFLALLQRAQAQQ